MTNGEHLLLRARQLAGELVSGDELRWLHVQQVAQCAEGFSGGLDDGERDLVISAAWLHDIGYADELAVTGFHAADGARHLVLLGWPATVCGLVAFHTGATYEAEERGIPEALAQFEPPLPHLLDTLTAADVSVGPDGARVDPQQRIAEILARYDAEDPVHRAVRRSAPELLACVDRTVRRLTLEGVSDAGGQPM